MVGRTGALAAGAVAFMGAWILLKTQFDIIEGMTRAITGTSSGQATKKREPGAGAMSEWFITACLAQP